jgi:hypothetical protein
MNRRRGDARELPRAAESLDVSATRFAIALLWRASRVAQAVHGIASAGGPAGQIAIIVDDRIEVTDDMVVAALSRRTLAQRAS